MRGTNWTGHHCFGLVACLVGFVAAGLVAVHVFEQVPHLEDEVAYLFQAQVFAAGKMYVSAPVYTSCFFAPFILDHEGRRFGKYPPGWPVLLAAGVRLGQLWWINAACAALTVALVYRLGCEMHGPLAGAVAAGLAATSPFLIMLSGSLMSHPSSLLFVTLFLWCFWRTFRSAHPGWPLAAGISLGCAFAIRPFTALAIALPAGLYTLLRATTRREWKRAWYMVLGFAPLALVVPAANALWTGDPFTFPYALFWPYDRLGFGPGHGIAEGGNTVWMGLGSAVLSVGLLATHLQGWPALSLTFVILLFMLKPRRFWDLFLTGTALSLILGYVLYWTNGDVFGPRYIYESSSALLILSAAGIVRVGQWARTRKRGPALLSALLVLLIGINLFVYLPGQVRRYQGLYGITAKPRRILEAADLHRALVIVRDDNGWKDYAVAFSMNAPTLDGDVVYASECPLYQEQLLDQFANRKVYYFDGEAVRSLP